MLRPCHYPRLRPPKKGKLYPFPALAHQPSIDWRQLLLGMSHLLAYWRHFYFANPVIIRLDLGRANLLPSFRPFLGPGHQLLANLLQSLHLGAPNLLAYWHHFCFADPAAIPSDLARSHPLLLVGLKKISTCSGNQTLPRLPALAPSKCRLILDIISWFYILLYRRARHLTEKAKAADMPGIFEAPHEVETATPTRKRGARAKAPLKTSSVDVPVSDDEFEPSTRIL